eukprot:8826698-Alexandrium_andersonii.AAC.1
MSPPSVAYRLAHPGAFYFVLLRSAPTHFSPRPGRGRWGRASTRCAARPSSSSSTAGATREACGTATLAAPSGRV